MRVLDVHAGTPEARWDPTNEDEHQWWPRILWLDPGVVSGVAVLWFDPTAVFGGEPLARCLLAVSDAYIHGPEIGPGSHVVRFLALRRELAVEPGLAIGCETFKPLRVALGNEFLAPVRIRAALEHELLMEQAQSPLHLQSPGDALGAFNNDRLRQLTLYSEGPDHKNDAKRHCLLWIQRLRAQGVDFFYNTHGHEPKWFNN